MTSSYAGFKPRQRPVTSARRPNPQSERMQQYREQGDAAVAEPFRGITTDGTVVPGLFRLQTTGVSTRPITDAAAAFLASLGPDERARATFPLDSDAWRRWSNIHVFVMRHGAMLEEMDEPRREAGLGLLRETLSPEGFELSRNIMRLNHVIGELTGRWDEYGEWPYWVSIMGEPSADGLRGWQIDGHHLIVNCLVVGDQIVTTPMFMGSEPCEAFTGQFAGVRVFRAEESDGLAFMQSLGSEQQKHALLSAGMPGEVFTSAFRDNFELTYEGVRYGDLSTDEQAKLLKLIEIYVNRTRAGHARVRMAEVKERLDETYFAWIGGHDDDSVFYYRIHSPVILIEFDHQRGVALDNDTPSRNHIHTVVRTPNGNDYGKDLLRQHHEQFDHGNGAAHE